MNGDRIIDTHCHVGANWFEPVETLLFLMRAHGVAQALLVQHGGVFDHSYLFDCARIHAGRFRVVAQLDPDEPDQIGLVEQLAAQGAAGIRLSPASRARRGDPFAVWRRAGTLGLTVSCQGSMQAFASSEFRGLLDACPETPIVIEHLAGVRRAEPPYEHFGAALECSSHPNAYMKVPGLGEIVPRPSRLKAHFQLSDKWRLIERAMSAFGPERLMWGSDFPGVLGREGYGNALSGASHHPAISGTDAAAWVLGRTASNVWGFSAPEQPGNEA